MGFLRLPAGLLSCAALQSPHSVLSTESACSAASHLDQRVQASVAGIRTKVLLNLSAWWGAGAAAKHGQPTSGPVEGESAAQRSAQTCSATLVSGVAGRCKALWALLLVWNRSVTPGGVAAPQHALPSLAHLGSGGVLGVRQLGGVPCIARNLIVPAVHLQRVTCTRQGGTQAWTAGGQGGRPGKHGPLVGRAAGQASMDRWWAGQGSGISEAAAA